jgi:hypothetical protein
MDKRPFRIVFPRFNKGSVDLNRPRYPAVQRMEIHQRIKHQPKGPPKPRDPLRNYIQRY